MATDVRIMNSVTGESAPNNTAPARKGTTYLRAINRAMREEMERDPAVLVIGLDVGRQGGIFGATRGLYERFGGTRVVDTPISEAGFTGAAIGMAMEGLRPVVEMQFADFVTVAFDQLATVAAKMHYLTQGRTNVPLVVRMPYGASIAGKGYMTGAGPHHSQSPEAWFCHLAGIKVVMPSTPADALGLLKAAIRDDNPVMFFEQKAMYYSLREDLPEGDHLVPLGVADVKRRGTDATIIATGATVHQALAVADRLATEGASIEVVDPRTLVPLDTGAILASAAKTGRVVITHEAAQTSGFGAEIAALIAEHGFGALRAPVLRICARDMPVPAGLAARASLPSEARIEAAVRELLKR
jgi:acetoin:2,6-dichlorophenolindophenol oxidoreductase subunit beta